MYMIVSYAYFLHLKKETANKIRCIIKHQSQIVGLYKDPDGKNITTFKPNSEKDSATVDKSTSGSEVKELQRKVVELETSLKQYVRE